MSELDTLLQLSAGTLLAALVLGRVRWMGWLATLLYAAQFMALIDMSSLAYEGGQVASSLSFQVMGMELGWRFDALSWFFALITLGAAFCSSMFMSGEWGERYRAEGGSTAMLHVALAANVLAMLLLLASGDFLSLFVGWELVSWASFLMMVLAAPGKRDAAIRYITYAMAGAMAMLAGLAVVNSLAGSLVYADFVAKVPELGTGQVITLVLLFGFAFGVKMALLPVHLWQAVAYAETPGPGTAFLGAISSRMGFYAIIVVLAQLIGLDVIGRIEVPFTFLDVNELLAWLAVLTIILPTFTALKQNDARRLLAWHGIGQGGFMLLGLVTVHELGSAGGMFHVFNHATYQAALFFSVYAVVMRTGTADLNRLGGLVARMPLSFLVMLFGIIGLAGLPPMNGFVSKWLIYRTLIDQGSPLLFVGAVIGTLGTILSVFKLIHNTFLGQLRLEHEEVAEAPWSMMIPMLLLSAVVLVTGIMPGLVLEWIAQAQAAVGLPVIKPDLGGVTYKGSGLDMIWIGILLVYGIGVGWLLFSLGGRSKRVSQLDNYAGGHFLTAETRYHYSDHFYAGLMHLIGPWYRGTFTWMQSAVVSATELVSTGVSSFYRNVQPSMLLLGSVVVILFWVVL
ncbi:MAG: proton-conducting transporter membrane subunit [Gammaproteobacteria bacterium]